MRKEYLWEKLGPTIQEGLRDNNVFEIMLNPDNSVWFKYQDSGNNYIGGMERQEAHAFCHALAQYEGKYLNDFTPYLDATLPFHGERVNITMPPISENVSFNIRKKAKRIFTLDDYVESKILTQIQVDILKRCIRDRKNILISGGPASGKTTLANALLASLSDIVSGGHRVLILEQVPELQCQVKNVKSLLVSDSVSMKTLLWIALRNSPDRIVVGEVRDGAALDLLKAWNTGCPGGVATIHANSANAAVQRVLDLACEIVVTPPFLLAAEALDVIIHIQEQGSHSAGRVVTEIVSVCGFNSLDNSFHFKRLDT